MKGREDKGVGGGSEVMNQELMREVQMKEAKLKKRTERMRGEGDEMNSNWGFNTAKDRFPIPTLAAHTNNPHSPSPVKWINASAKQ